MPDAPAAAPMIFISYRRDDSSGHVGRLYDALSAHFGRKRLFFDIDHIAPGQDFVRVLEDSLNRSSVMIVVMGKRWGGTGKIGSRRIDDPGQELKMIPALISGAKMLGPSALPEELKDLSRRNAIELSDTRWREDVERLIASLEQDMADAAPRHAAAADLVRRAREITHAPALSGGGCATGRGYALSRRCGSGAGRRLRRARAVRSQSGEVEGSGGCHDSDEVRGNHQRHPER